MEKDPSSSETLVKAADDWAPFVGISDLYTVAPLWQSYITCVPTDFRRFMSLAAAQAFCDTGGGNYDKMRRMAHVPDRDSPYYSSRRFPSECLWRARYR